MFIAIEKAVYRLRHAAQLVAVDSGQLENSSSCNEMTFVRAIFYLRRKQSRKRYGHNKYGFQDRQHYGKIQSTGTMYGDPVTSGCMQVRRRSSELRADREARSECLTAEAEA